MGEHWAIVRASQTAESATSTFAPTAQAIGASRASCTQVSQSSSMPLEEFLQRYDLNPETKLQMTLLRRLLPVLKESSVCLGAVLLGSFAKGLADRVSDLDLVLFCREGTGPELLASVAALIPAEEIFSTFQGSHEGVGSPFTELILYNFTSIEIHTIAPGTKFTVKKPFVELHNIENCLEARLSQSSAPTRDVLVPYRHGPNWLPWELFNCLKWLSRGDVETAKKYLVRLGKAIEAADKPCAPPHKQN